MWSSQVPALTAAIEAALDAAALRRAGAAGRDVPSRIRLRAKEEAVR